MEYAIIAVTVVIGSGLTFFSGFGLGTLLLPVFSLFFDPAVAVGATAIVHLANNLFKFALVSKYIHLPTLLRFGIPAIGFAFLGSYLLTKLSASGALYAYEIGGSAYEVTSMNLVIGILMIIFAWIDLSPKFNSLNIPAKYQPLGGSLSGFFGGISGHQGAFRAAFLAKAGLNKEQFVGTSNAISLCVDLTRIPVYLGLIQIGSKKALDLREALSEGSMLLVVGISAAFIGAVVGKQLIRKTTIAGVQKLVGVLLFAMGALIISGLIS